MYAGTAEIDITPPVGSWIVGNTTRSTGVHDPLYARALVLSDSPVRDTNRVAIVTMDITGLSWDLGDVLRAEIRNATGIKTVLINFSHTHNAPMLFVGEPDTDRELEQELGAWLEGLRRGLPELVAEANSSLSPVTLRTGRARAQVGFNRRLMSEGQIQMKVNREGAVVPWVDVLQVCELSGTTKAILFAHAAHPVIVHWASTLISADYPGYACYHVKQNLGRSVVPMFAQGCGADINGFPLRGGFKAAERAGVRLWEAVEQALENSRELGADSFDVMVRQIQLPGQDWPAEEECDAMIGQIKQALERGQQEWLDEHSAQYRIRCLEQVREFARRDRPAQLRFEIVAVAIGSEFCLVAMPHEVFCEYALWIDETAPFANTMVLGYTNGCEAYVPTDSDLALGPIGGYEAAAFPAWTTANLQYPIRTPLKRGIEKRIKHVLRSMRVAR